jgi:hypothetical protein
MHKPDQSLPTWQINSNKKNIVKLSQIVNKVLSERLKKSKNINKQILKQRIIKQESLKQKIIKLTTPTKIEQKQSTPIEQKQSIPKPMDLINEHDDFIILENEEFTNLSEDLKI